MKLINSLKMKAKLAVLAGTAIIGFIGYFVFSYQLMQVVAVNGSLYNEIVNNKDLVADILPPPEYIIETYLVTKQILEENDSTKKTGLINRFPRLEKDFHERHDFWNSRIPPGSLHDLLLVDSYEPGLKFFNVLNNDFISAIKNNDIEKAKVIHEVNDIVSTIAAAVEEQSVSSQEISNNISQASQGIEEVNQNVNQTSAVSSSISSDIAEVNRGVQDITANSSQVDMKAIELAQLATQLQQLVGRFKI